MILEFQFSLEVNQFGFESNHWQAFVDLQNYRLEAEVCLVKGKCDVEAGHDTLRKDCDLLLLLVDGFGDVIVLF